MITMKEVAARAGVSATTVSHVINNTRTVSAVLRERVLAAVHDLGYRPDQLARSLRQGSTLTLGLILPDVVNPFFAELARSIEDAGHARGYSVILCNSDQDVERELLYTRLLIDKRVDGVLFVAVGLSGEHVELLQHHRIPVVVVDREVSVMNSDLVMIDDMRGGYLAGEYLVRLGHKRIGFINNVRLGGRLSQRILGAMNAMREAGVDPDQGLVVQGSPTDPIGFPAARQLLAMDHPPTAIFAINDMLAIVALQGVAKIGVHVPGDVSVMGFDNIRMASLSNPALTTVAQPIAQKGRLAVEVLLERIKHPDLPPRRVVLDTQVVERASTGPAPARPSKH